MKATASKEDTFVPFGPATLNAAVATPGQAPSLKVVPGDKAGNTFSPLQIAGVMPGESSNRHTTTAVALQKDGDRITGIRVECACGQVIELACDYGLTA